MKTLFISAFIAVGLAGCANPPPPELIQNTAQWAQIICDFVPTADQIIEILDHNENLADTRAVAKVLCAAFAP